MTTDVRFFVAEGGARIAYEVSGSGPPLLLLPPWSSHLVRDEALSGHGGLIETLRTQHTVVRHDRWGSGLSSRDRDDFSMQRDLGVLTALVEHLRLRRVTLVGPSQGAPLGVAFAHRFPRRVSHLVLYGSPVSTVTSGPTWTAMRALILTNWPVAARSIAAVATRGSDPTDVEALTGSILASVTPRTIVALQEAALREDVSGLLGELRVPTLVLHRRDDEMVSAQEAVELAARIPGCRLEIVDGAAHALSAGDSGAIARRICAFTAGGYRSPTSQVTPREAEILDLVAQGHTNVEVAERLGLSVRTVERHLLNAYARLGARGRADAVARWTARAGDAGQDPPA